MTPGPGSDLARRAALVVMRRHRAELDATIAEAEKARQQELFVGVEA